MLLTGFFIREAAAAENLLKNGDFSNGTSQWQIRQKNGTAVLEKAGPDGQNVLKAVSVKEFYAANYSIRKEMIKPDTNYTLRGKIKTEGNISAYLRICCTSEGKPYHLSTKEIRNNSDWTEVSVIINSRKTDGLPVLIRAIGQGTVWVSDISVMEGNHMPVENLLVNSDFKQKTRYKEIPDNWSGGLQTPIAEAENYICRLSNIPGPVSGAGVMELRRVLMRGNLTSSLLQGHSYTFSFYAKNALPGTAAEMHVRFGKTSRWIKLTDEWKRYIFTEDLSSGPGYRFVRAVSPDAAMHFSAPQLVIGRQALPWSKPAVPTVQVMNNIKEAVAEAESRRIRGEPQASDWSGVPAYPISLITRGKPDAILETYAKILHNDQYVFIQFTGKRTPDIKEGNSSRLDWGNLNDCFELFLTDTALDGTYIHHAVDVRGFNYTGRGFVSEILGITSKIVRKNDEWQAEIRVPLKVFRANRNWKAAFCRTYDHKKYGRTALDWSLSGSRHMTGNFGILKGISVKPVESLRLKRLYASDDNRKICYEFTDFTPQMRGSVLKASIVLNGKFLWQKSLPFNGARGTIELPENYETMMQTETRIALAVESRNKEIFYQASRVLYLTFSSFARFHEGMCVYPKYNLFTERDKTIDLIVRMDKKQFDRLRISLLGKNSSVILAAETAENLSIPCDKIEDGTYRIRVEALKQGKTVETRCFETFMKKPFHPELYRINRLSSCLMDAKGVFIPMPYYPCGSSTYAFEPDSAALKDRMFEGLLKAGFNGLKINLSIYNPQKIAHALAQAEKFKTPYLADLSDNFPKGYYNFSQNKLSGPETEKIMIENVQKLQKLCFGKPGIYSYAPYHEPGYYRMGKGIVDSHRVAAILPELKKCDPYRPITGFWAPPHWNENGEPFGSIDGVDYFIVDVYTRDLKRHCDELFRIANAARTVHRPIGQIFNVDNLGSDLRECPTPKEYRAELCTALIAGYRIFYIYIGMAPVRETWHEIVECNRRLPQIAAFICDDNCTELCSVNEDNVCYAVYRRGNEVMLIAANKRNDGKSRLNLDLKKISGLDLENGKALFEKEALPLKNGIMNHVFGSAGSGIWIFKRRSAD